MSKLVVSRRTLLKGGALGALGLASGVLPGRLAFAADGLTIGIVYVGPRDDFGWNQAHAVAKTMESMIELDGANLIFATSFGYYSPFVVDEAKKYPAVQFRHAAPLWKDGDPKNAGSYFGYLDQAHYINGIAGGLSSKSNKIGFVAAKPISSVLSNINSVLIGARKTNPNATVQVIFTGDWSLPVREAEATNALVDAGCDVITCHVDSPKVVIQTAESRGVKTLGHNASQAPLAPKGFITGAEYKWITIYGQYAKTLSGGGTLPNMLVGGYDLDFVQNTAYGAGATDAAKVEMAAKKPYYVGPLKDNTGKEVIAAGTSHAPYDPWIDNINFLAEGVVGSVT